MSTSVALLTDTLTWFIQIYTALIIIRVLLSWFPNINWYAQPFAILSQLTDPYLRLFRSIIPPLGGIDFSPWLALILLEVLSSFLASIPGQVALGGGI